MNIKEFRKTKKFTKNLAEYTNELEHDQVPGYVYLDSYYIFDKLFEMNYYLILENLDFENEDLSVLEEKLYNYCNQIGALE